MAQTRASKFMSALAELNCQLVAVDLKIEYSHSSKSITALLIHKHYLEKMKGELITSYALEILAPPTLNVDCWDEEES